LSLSGLVGSFGSLRSFVQYYGTLVRNVPNYFIPKALVSLSTVLRDARAERA